MRTMVWMVMAATLLAAGCQQRRGPASTEAKELVQGGPPVVAEAPVDDPLRDAVEIPLDPAEQPARPQAQVQPQGQPTAPVQPTPVQPAPAPAPVAPATRAAVAATTPATVPVPAGALVYVAADADEATRLRNWPVSVAHYGNGNVVAGPAYRWIPAQPKSNRYKDFVVHEAAATGLAVGQVIATPLWWLVTPPWRAVEYHGEQIPPSYTVDERVPYYVKEKVPGIWVVGE